MICPRNKVANSNVFFETSPNVSSVYNKLELLRSMKKHHFHFSFPITITTFKKSNDKSDFESLSMKEPDDKSGTKSEDKPDEES